MSSRKLEYLHPIMQSKAIALIDNCQIKGVELLIYCTYRSWMEQNRLYDIGRGAPGKIVTWAKGGESLHNHTVYDQPASLAFDCVPLVGGKAYWTIDDVSSKLWAIVAAEAKKLGLEWAGNWSPPKREYPHFQISKGDLQHVQTNKAQN